jgi:hypothetical protein
VRLVWSPVDAADEVFSDEVFSAIVMLPWFPAAAETAVAACTATAAG